VVREWNLLLLLLFFLFLRQRIVRIRLPVRIGITIDP
jgi:hypothetical protein